MKQFLDCVSIGHEEFLLYYIGKIVVILNIKSGQQRHYNCHLASVSSLTANGEIVATGESSSKPQIRIWNSRTLKTLLVIEGTHVHTIHLLKFFCNGDLLISSDCSRKSPILIHDTISGDILFTAFCDYPSVEICLLSNFTIHTTC